MKPILKFRLLYLVLVIAPFLFIFILSIDVKKIDVFAFIICEIILIGMLGLLMYIIEDILRVRFYKEKSAKNKILDISIIFIYKALFLLSPLIILRFILIPYFSS
ncbi:hypothetical protein NUBL13938_51410 [Klebsiella pneumoniae]|nr:hypothetical protein NUBL13938_51410 [Klebsiella pneumoniae]HCI7934431.1 hypothetical protein [Klebsiella pneumoniae]